jgi:hypothetical protein
MVLNLEMPLLFRKNGRSINVERVRRHVAMAIGGASVNRISIEAVETATILTSRTRFGGTPGLSPNLIPRILSHDL